MTRRQIVYRGGFNGCYGCGAANPDGLRLQFFETEVGVEVDYSVATQLQGAAGVVHGGIQATLLDETMCMTAYAKLGMPVVTGELTVRYVAPVPTATPLVIRGRIAEVKGRSAFIEGEILTAGGDRTLTLARGRFFAGA